MLPRDCSPSCPPRACKVSYAETIKRLHPPETAGAPLSRREGGGGSRPSWEDNKMRMNSQSGIKDKEKNKCTTRFVRARPRVQLVSSVVPCKVALLCARSVFNFGPLRFPPLMESQSSFSQLTMERKAPVAGCEGKVTHQMPLRRRLLPIGLPREDHTYNCYEVL